MYDLVIIILLLNIELIYFNISNDYKMYKDLIQFYKYVLLVFVV